MSWVLENLSTIIVSGILILIVFLIVRSMHQDKINGKSSCSNDCGGCALSGSCHNRDENPIVKAYYKN